MATALCRLAVRAASRPCCWSTSVARSSSPRNGLLAVYATSRSCSSEALKFPSDFKYSKTHEWVQLAEDKKTAKIGITDFAQSELGDVVFVDVNSAESDYVKGDAFGCLEAVKTVADLLMPCDGQLVKVNGKLKNQPQLVNQDPYGKGWIAEVAVSDPTQLDDMLTSEAYQAEIA